MPSAQTTTIRHLSLWNGVSIIMGVIIGSGIFISPKGVLLEAGSPAAALCVWALCGLLAMLGALCFAELGASIPHSGGEYTYIRLAYGPLPGFLYLWITVTIIMPCGNAITALTFANYVLQPLLQFTGPSRHLSGFNYSSDQVAFFNDTNEHHCQRPSETALLEEQKPDGQAIRLVALSLVWLLVYVNCVSIIGSIRLQSLFTWAKVLALALVIACGLWHLIALGEPFASASGGSGSLWWASETSAPKIAQAFYAGFYTYAGWNSLNCVTEELKDPVRSMPRAILLSITSITLIYILTNAAYFALLTRAEILASDAIAVTLGQKVLPSNLAWLMPLSVALSTMGGLNGSIFAYSRVLMVGARRGQLFSALRLINLANQTPQVALIFLGLMTSLYLLETSILTLINYMIFVEAALAALGVSTQLALRYKWPQLERPLKVNALVPAVYLLASLLLVILPLWLSPVEAITGAVIFLAGLPVYYLAEWAKSSSALRRGESRASKLTATAAAIYGTSMDSLTGVVQKLTLSVDAEGRIEVDQ